MKAMIILGGDFNRDFVADFYKSNSYDYVMAVDGGERYAVEAGLPIDLLVGDFDTRGVEVLTEYRDRGIRILQSIPQKDDTDSEMAIRECIRMGMDCDIFCGTGGRLDHFLGTLHNMKLMMDAGLRARMIDPQNILWLCEDKAYFDGKQCPYKYISFVPFSGEVTGITLKGFLYEVEDFTLRPGLTRCVSNELKEEQAKLTAKSGVLIVINSRD